MKSIIMLFLVLGITGCFISSKAQSSIECAGGSAIGSELNELKTLVNTFVANQTGRENK